LRLERKRFILGTYSIRDLETISGIKAHTLRMWEQRYEILQPKRTDTNIRFYEEDDLRLLLSISMLNNNGFKISQIAKMNHSEIHLACHSLHDVADEFAHQINTLVLAMIELDEDRFEKAIANSALKYGFEDTMIKIIHPFFERVGILWQTGTVRPVQEHFISSLIRQKLIVAIDAQLPVKGEAIPKYALYLPENEMHEMSLLFANYILRSRGNRVLYLGQNVPEEDLESVFETFAPDYFLTILTIAPAKESMQSYLDRLGNRFPKARFLVSGIATQGLKSTLDNVIVLEKVQELLRYADRG
jgi:MerR family transcriptional regulator, light-induced transcriptional regulator